MLTVSKKEKNELMASLIHLMTSKTSPMVILIHFMSICPYLYVECYVNSLPYSYE